jgi:hypothetical protein
MESGLKETISVCLDVDQIWNTAHGVIVCPLARLPVQGARFQHFGNGSDEEEAKRIIGAPVRSLYPDFEGTTFGIHLPIIQLPFDLDGSFTG